MENNTLFVRDRENSKLIEVNGVYFTKREAEIIAHLMGGKTIKTIANSLNLSPRTIESHLNQIKLKINKTSRDGIIEFIENSGKLLDFKQYYLSNMKGYESSSFLEKSDQPEKNYTRFSIKDHRFFLLLISFSLLILFSFRFSHGEKVSIRSELLIPSKKVLLERPELIKQIEKKLNGKKGIQTIALIGPLGAGKTTLAFQFAKLQKACVIWEINAETKETLIKSFFELAYALAEKDGKDKEIGFIKNIDNYEERNIQLLVFIKRYLRKASSWLLIYNDVQDISEIYSYLPNDPDFWGTGKTIIITKHGNIENSGYLKPNQIIHVGELSKAEALMLFSKILYKTKSKKLSLRQTEKALSLLKDTSFFPLDICVQAYYLKNVRLPRD